MQQVFKVILVILLALIILPILITVGPALFVAVGLLLVIFFCIVIGTFPVLIIILFALIVFVAIKIVKDFIKVKKRQYQIFKGRMVGLKPIFKKTEIKKDTKVVVKDSTGKWNRGVVTKLTEKADKTITYDVEYDDDELNDEKDIPADRIRKRNGFWGLATEGNIRKKKVAPKERSVHIVKGGDCKNHKEDPLGIFNFFKGVTSKNVQTEVPEHHYAKNI